MTDMEAFLENSVKTKDFKHENILSVLGIAIVREKPFAAFPFMANRSLLEFVRNQKNVRKYVQVAQFHVKALKPLFTVYMIVHVLDTF